MNTHRITSDVNLSAFPFISTFPLKRIPHVSLLLSIIVSLVPTRTTAPLQDSPFTERTKDSLILICIINYNTNLPRRSP